MALLLRPKRILLLNPKPYLARLLSSAAAPGDPPSPPRRQAAQSPLPNEPNSGFGLARLFKATTKADGDSQKTGTVASVGASNGVGLRKVETAEADELIDFMRNIGRSNEEVKVGVYRNELQKKIEVLRGEGGGSKNGFAKRKVGEGKGKRVKGLERVDWDEELGGLEENGSGDDGGLEVRGMGVIGEGDWDEELGEVVEERKRTEAEVVKGGKVESTDGEFKKKDSRLSEEKGEGDWQARKRMNLERMKAEWKMVESSWSSSGVKKDEKEMRVKASELERKEKSVSGGKCRSAELGEVNEEADKKIEEKGPEY